MENPFKNRKPPKKEDGGTNLAEQEALPYMKERISDAAEKDLERSTSSDSEFIEREKHRNGIEGGSAIEAEIASAVNKHESRKRNLKSALLRKLGKLTKYTLGGIAGLSMTVHFGKKEFPDYLENHPEPKKIEWNESTKNEIEKLANEYALLLKDEAKYADFSHQELEERFMKFAQDFGPDIKIIHPGEDMEWDDEIFHYVFENVLKQPGGQAHVAMEGTLFYEEKTLQRHENDSTKYDWSTTGIRDFVAEMSHHINNDWSVRRAFSYADDLAAENFKQGRMYGDPFSSEYQAHTVTQNAIAAYLNPEKGSFNKDFPTVYNLYQEYYRKFVDVRGYERPEDTDEVSMILYFNDFDSLESKKETIFGNLDHIRNRIDATNFTEEEKGELFGMLINTYNIEKNGNDYESMLNNAEDLLKPFAAKESFIEGKIDHREFAAQLEDHYLGDKEYLHASLTLQLFDNKLIDSLQKNPEKFEEYEDKNRIFSLYIYGTAKAVEGKAFGYESKDMSTGDFRYACYEYSTYLKGVSRFIRDNPDYGGNIDVNDLEEKIKLLDEYEYLIDALEHYINNKDTETINEDILTSARYREDGSWPSFVELMLRLRNGSYDNPDRDIKRDFFFEDGRSPLKSVLLEN